MKKCLTSVIVLLCMLLCLTGCGDGKTHKAYTYSVETGDSIDIQMDTTGGYDITSEVPFAISLDGETLSQGMFIAGENYEQYVAAANTDKAATVLDSGSYNGNEYVFWSYNDSEYNIAVKIEGSKTGLLLGNVVSEESARECFERLTITVK